MLPTVLLCPYPHRIWYETAKRLNGVLNPDAIRYIDNLLGAAGMTYPS
jgi:hypothetical protein